MWILIFYVIQWGEAIHSNAIKFHSQKACLEALDNLSNTTNTFGGFNDGRISIRGVCEEDK